VPDADLIELFVEPLNRAGLTYMVTGSVASMLYAEPRLTADVDVVARVTDPERLRSAFASPAYYCPPADVIAVEAARPLHGHVNILHLPSALKADVYPLLAAQGERLDHATLERLAEERGVADLLAEIRAGRP
jgi:hypothetical protein